FFQEEDGIRYFHVTGVQTCALPIFTGFTQMSPSGPVLSWSGGVIGVPFENNEFTVLDLNTDWNHVGAYYEFDEESEEKTQFSVRSEERRVGKECGSRVCKLSLENEK